MLNFKQKQFLTIAAVAIVLAGSAYYFLRDEPLDEKKADKGIVTRMAFKGTSLVEELNGKRIWELSARVIEVDTQTKLVYLQDVKAVIYREKGDSIAVTAREAIANPTTRDMEMTGDVKAVASDGPTFSGPKVQYFAKEKRIVASGGIRLTREDIVATGDELETDDRIELVKVKGHAHVVKGGEKP